MVALKQKWIIREDLQANPDTIYVFGDNLARVGMGGQAKEMRGEPNAFGIPTKAIPSHGSRECYMDDNNADHWKAVVLALNAVESYIWAGHTVIFPEDGVGTGLAKLEEYAPHIFNYVQSRIADMLAIYGEID